MKYRMCWLGCLLVLLAVVTPGLARDLYFYNMDSDPGWSATGGWHYGLGATSLFCVNGGHTGTNVYGYAISGVSCRYPASIAGDTLTTTPFDCSNLTGVTVSFWRQLGLALDTIDYIYVDDHASIQVSNDGLTWNTIWSTSSNAWDACDCGWTYQQYDISQYADGQPTVYIRWIMGPTDGGCGCKGFNIDDVTISANAPEILLWVPYCPWTDELNNDEFFNLTDILFTNLPNCTIMWLSFATDAATLQSDLQGNQVLIIPEPELADSITLAALGAEFADVLQEFVYGGGTVIMSSDFTAPGFLSAAGLMQAVPAGYYYGGETLTVVDPLHPLAAGVSNPVVQNSTFSYHVPPDTFPIITDAEGNAVVAERQYGAGATILIGYDYYAFDTNAQNVLINSFSYPGSQKVVLVYEHTPYNMRHTAKRALHQLRTNYYFADQTTFNGLLEYTWSAIAMDDPVNQPEGGWNPLFNYLISPSISVPTLISTWGLTGVNTGADVLASACEADAVGSMDNVPDLYDWASGSGLFTRPNSVPTPIDIWSKRWGYSADQLRMTSDYAYAVAGFNSPSYEAGNAAIVAGNCYATLLNGFLWEESDLDADSDGVYDVEELVTNQLAFLIRVPDPYFTVDTYNVTAGGTVNFTNLTCGPEVKNAWCFNWYPESLEYNLLNDTCPTLGLNASYTYDNVGFFFPVLEAWNDNGYRRVTLDTPIAVGFADTPTDSWAFRQIIACAEAGIVQGYWDGYHPATVVKRDQMATFIARAMCGGDDAVPAGPGTPTFADVAADHWAYDYIEYCAAQNIAQGYWDGYHPNTEVKRDQMAVYMARCLVPYGERPDLPSYTPPATATFPDVATDNWAFKYIEFCYANGIVSGYWDGYHPTTEVKRDQMSVYIQRAFDLETYEP